jgi:hypothetical protein
MLRADFHKLFIGNEARKGIKLVGAQNDAGWRGASGNYAEVAEEWAL